MSWGWEKTGIVGDFEKASGFGRASGFERASGLGG
jgi:hypothetical protein